jgi:hypothetical protein
MNQSNPPELKPYNLHPNLQTPYEPHRATYSQVKYASPMENNKILSHGEETSMTMQTLYPNRYTIPNDVQARGQSHQINSNLVYHNNKEGWNSRQFDRNTDYGCFYNQSHQNRFESMDMVFTDNYKKQREEAYEQFQKRNRSMEQPTNSYSTQSNLRFGFVDFQDPQYRDYLKSKEVKRKETPNPVETDYRSYFSTFNGRK